MRDASVVPSVSTGQPHGVLTAWGGRAPSSEWNHRTAVAEGRPPVVPIRGGQNIRFSAEYWIYSCLSGITFKNDDKMSCSQVN